MNELVEKRRLRNHLRKSPEKTLNELVLLYTSQFNSLLASIQAAAEKALNSVTDEVLGTQKIRDIAQASARDEVQFIKDILESTKTNLLKDINSFKDKTCSELLSTLKDNKDSIINEVKIEKDKLINDTIESISQSIKLFETSLDSKIKDIEDKISTIKKIVVKPGEPGKDANPKDVVPYVLKELSKNRKPQDLLTKEDVAKMLEAQQKDFMRIIERLQTSIKQAKKGGGGASGGGGDIIRVDHFYGDGSNKIFTLSQAPRTINKVMVHCSDFPNIYRPTVDFTISGKVLTLTAAVDAPTDTATFIVQYVV